MRNSDQSVRTGMTATFVVIALLCAGAAGIAVRYRGAARWVNHTTDVIAEIRETRGLLSGTPALSGSAQRTKVDSILDQFERVADLTHDNARQQKSAADFREVFAAATAGSGADGTEIDAGTTAAANVILDRMTAEEYRLLVDRIRVQSEATTDGATAVCLLCLVLMALSVVTARASRRHFLLRAAAEEALLEDKEELTSYSRRLAQVSAGSELIQAAQDEAQINEAVAQVMRDLLPDSRGYFGMVNPSSNAVEICATWGQGLEARPFAPSDCVALRLGRPVFRDREVNGVSCNHARTPSGESGCIPVRGATGPLGVLHLETEETLQGKAGDVLGVFAVHVGLGLTNLRMREALRRQTVRDPLTGLFNRRYFDETLRRECSAIARHGMPVSVLMLDIDHFKPMNDTYGHGAGDEALRTLSGLFRTVFRETDVVCRYGGDEFAVILTGADLEAARRRGESFRRAVEQQELRFGDNSSGRMTISVGVATSSEFPDPLELVRAADAALYEAKRMRRNAAPTGGDAQDERLGISTL